jgi:hypothetical protein
MEHPPQRHEGRDKAGGNGEKPLTKTEAKVAMGRFRSLTRGLLDVPHEELKAAEKRYSKAKANRKKKKGSSHAGRT